MWGSRELIPETTSGDSGDTLLVVPARTLRSTLCVSERCLSPSLTTWRTSPYLRKPVSTNCSVNCAIPHLLHVDRISLNTHIFTQMHKCESCKRSYIERTTIIKKPAPESGPARGHLPFFLLLFRSWCAPEPEPWAFWLWALPQAEAFAEVVQHSCRRALQAGWGSELEFALHMSTTVS